MGYIFISYSHKDRAYANKLADEMKRRGIEPWIDERIDYGDQWPHVIQEQLEASSAVAIIMSTDAYESKWVLNELTFAQHIGKEIFPLLLEGKLWLSLSSTQHVDVRNEKLPPDSYFNKLKSLIEGTPAAPAIRMKQKSTTSGQRRPKKVVPDEGSLQDRIFKHLAQAVREKRNGKWKIGLYNIEYIHSVVSIYSFSGHFDNRDLLRRNDPIAYKEYMNLFKDFGDQRKISPLASAQAAATRNLRKLLGSGTRVLIEQKLELSLSGTYAHEPGDREIKDFVEKLIQNHIYHHIPLDQIKIQTLE